MTAVQAPPAVHHAPAPATSAEPIIADPMPIAYGLFAFALALFGIRYADVDVTTLTAGPTTVGLNYALLVAAVAMIIAGVLGIVRGMGYPAYVTGTFGIWLLGFYLLVTSGITNKAFTPDAVAWYALALVIPVVIMAVPAFVYRNYPFVIGFTAITGLLVVTGLGYHSLQNALTDVAATKKAPDMSTAVDLVKVSGWLSLVAAAAVWWVFATEVYKLTGVRRSN